MKEPIKKQRGGKRTGSGRPPSRIGVHENHVMWFPKELWDNIIPSKAGEKSKNAFFIKAAQKLWDEVKDKEINA